MFIKTKISIILNFFFFYKIQNYAITQRLRQFICEFEISTYFNSLKKNKNYAF